MTIEPYQMLSMSLVVRPEVLNSFLGAWLFTLPKLLIQNKVFPHCAEMDLEALAERAMYPKLFRPVVKARERSATLGELRLLAIQYGEKVRTLEKLNKTT